jgi:hypothetical protein
MPLVDTPIAVNSINLGSNGLRIEEDLDVVDFTVSSGQVQTRFKVDGTRATTTVSDLLVDAPQGGQPGLFSLEDHFLVANQKMQIGSVTGPGRFNQRSDSNARTAFLRIYAGTYWKNEGALIAAQATIGEHPTVQALMDQDGGDATYDELLVGNAAPALAGAGRYDLDDGSVVVRNRMEVTAVGVFDMDGGTLEVKPQALEFVAGQFFQSSGQHKAWELNVSNEYRMTGGSLQVGTELFVYTPFDRQNLAIFNQIFGTVEAVDLAVDRATYTAGPDEPAVLGYTLTVTRDLKLKNGGTLRQFGVDVTATNMIIDAVLLPDTGATR